MKITSKIKAIVASLLLVGSASIICTNALAEGPRAGFCWNKGVNYPVGSEIYDAGNYRCVLISSGRADWRRF